MDRAAMKSMQYFQVTEQGELPGIGHLAPFKVVLAVEDDVSRARQLEVATWLVEKGGCYVMICGKNCEDWQQVIRQINLNLFAIEDIKPEQFVMITTHAHEKLRNVFWHANKIARHTHVKFAEVITIHLGKQNRSVEYLAMFEKA
jgi:hypothetical protein